MKNNKKNKGYCNICEIETVFYEYGDWLRDYYVCGKCMSIPRQRAIINALNIFVPNWRNLKIHESSPDGASSEFMYRNCKQYSSSQFFQDREPGSMINSVRCENLERLTYKDESFDVIITQDVFEHIINPNLAFQEISRTLTPGGVHVFTLPWNNKALTVKRVENKKGEVILLKEPVYHSNPVDSNGSLVTYDWGIDMPEYIFEHSGMYTTVYLEKNRNLGLDGEYLHVFISKKIFPNTV